jgi:CDGSH-type Zn-finger protein|eukprot:scaffold10272_cov276-Chaetoceros_neogracile.AAC.29
MKLAILSLTIAGATAFTAPFGVSRTSTAMFAEGDVKINTMIDLDAPKVVNQEALEAGGKKVYCRCWKSGTFPLCDAAHVKHNKENEDNVGPLIVSCAKAV